MKDDHLDRLRAAVSISSIIGKDVVLKRRGREYIGLCPFHHEKTPSFTVTDDKGFFHCFGCSAHGDIFKFVARFHGVSFSEAVKHVEQASGMARGRVLSSNRSDPTARADNARVRADTAREIERRIIAAMDAQKIVWSCVMANHPYLERKGFPDEVALVHEPTNRLVIPIWNSRHEIRSVQYVTADGGKRFHPGGEISRNFHRIGRNREVWLCEGYATGLSIRNALRKRAIDAEVRVCFSADNLHKVGRAAIADRMIVYVVPDHDWYRCAKGHKWDAPFSKLGSICPECGADGSLPPGQKAASVVGRPFWMPPTAGQDANDFHREHGLDALANELRMFRYPIMKGEHDDQG